MKINKISISYSLNHGLLVKIPCLILFFALLASGCAKKAQLQPNVLWITIEDTSPQFVGCYGNSISSTPVIDKLADQGVRFTNAFSTGTVCSPSRTAIITGVKTNLDFHKAIMDNPRFVAGEIDTHFIEKEKTLFDDLQAITARETPLADKLISSADKAKKAALIAASTAAAILQSKASGQ